MGSPRPSWTQWSKPGAAWILVFVLLLFALADTLPARAQSLANPGFEEARADGSPVGWTVLTGLDAARYNPPDYNFSFDAVGPIVTAPGRGGDGYALAFPGQGTWRCEVTEHDRGRIDNKLSSVSGSLRGKAAVYQSVRLPPGQYRFSAFLRTADGDGWSGTFSVGVAANGTTRYAHDAATGIAWTQSTLAMRGDPNGDYPDWGEWQRHATEPFEVTDTKPVSVWIRFNYVNQHQTSARWEVDDAAIERLPPWPVQIPSPNQIGNFRLELDFSPDDDWRELDIRFREVPDGNEGYVLSIVRDGKVELYSVADGLLLARKIGILDSPFHVRLTARSQYLRVDLPGGGGFETRIIGPDRGAFSVRAHPPGSGRSFKRITSAPADPPKLPVPAVGEFRKVYDPSVGQEQPWYINDHCVIRDATGAWHMFGITHAEPFSPLDEDFFAHATSRELMHVPWERRPPVCHVNRSAGETHVWAPHIVEKDGTYYMFYCGGGSDHDAYRINLRISTNLTDWQWYDGNPLFTDIGDARDPMVLPLEDGRYLMYYTRPSDLNAQFSSVAVRESDDLIHWSEPELALVAHRKQRFGRLTESPFVFRYEAGDDSAYYLSATGIGGYRGTLLWRSVNPRRFDADQIIARISAHAPEWIRTRSGPPGHVTHCGWGQGGFHIAPVRWVHRPWAVFGLLVVRDPSATVTRPTTVAVRRKNTDLAPYRSFAVREKVASCPLPPGRYRVTARRAHDDPIGPVPIEVMADRRAQLDLP